jgi:hypothetical protein
VNPEQVAEELNDPAAQALLESDALAHLAYVGPDGFPRVVPIGFYWDGTRIIVCTATTAPKVRALLHRPEVAMAIDWQGPPAKVLSVRGTADSEIVEGIPLEYLKASAKAMSEEQLAQFETQVRSVYRAMARISVTPLWAKVYDFGAGRVPTFLTRLGENQA